MNSIYRLTLLDRFLSPYNAAAFERLARHYVIGPRSSRFYAVFSLALAIMMLLGASALFATAAKSRYLAAYGVEVPGKILDVSFHTSRFRNRFVWKKLNYEFAASSGAVTRGQLDRPISELVGLADENHFTVLYWDRHPAINAPRGVQSHAGIATVLAVFLALCGVHFGMLSRRCFRWRPIGFRA